jgi:N-acyl-D-amino-acid deacylase
MTHMPAQRFGIAQRGLIREGFFADLVLFDADLINDLATFADPVRASTGIESVWVNGVPSYTKEGATGHRGGRFLPRGKTTWIQ